jgi:surface antigen
MPTQLAVAAAACAAVLAIASPAAAQCTDGVSKSTIGTLAGAAGGGLVGSQFGKGSGKTAMTIAGVLGGGVLGNQLGQRLDAEDCAQARASARSARTQRAMESAPAAGRNVSWRNPDAAGAGRPTWRDPATGRTCQEVESTAIIRGERQIVNGTACLDPDGVWRFVDGR